MGTSDMHCGVVGLACLACQNPTPHCHSGVCGQ
jgi:hypothetical protein